MTYFKDVARTRLLLLWPHQLLQRLWTRKQPGLWPSVAARELTLNHKRDSTSCLRATTATASLRHLVSVSAADAPPAQGGADHLTCPCWVCAGKPCGRRAAKHSEAFVRIIFSWASLTNQCQKPLLQPLENRCDLLAESESCISRPRCP